MFRDKQSKEPEGAVPVYTVDTVPRKYELLQTVCVEVKSSNLGAQAIRQIGVEGAKIGADAIIGFKPYANGTYGNNATNMLVFGTAIRYTD